MKTTRQKTCRWHTLPLLYLSLLLLLALPTLAACSPGHPGSNEITFIRNGHLWTINPDGSDAFAIVNDSLPVLSYSWSPSHQYLVYRQLDPTFASTTAGKHISYNSLTMEPGDLPSTINTISINGGTPMPNMFSSANISYSNPFWNPGGDHFIYRQETLSANSPTTALWLVSQDDQPGGIATKTLPSSYAIPSVATGTNTIVGDSAQGAFTTMLAGTNQHYLSHGSLPGHPLPATLERLLWQPAHQHPALLYAIAPPSLAAHYVQLVLRSASGQTSTLATCRCTQFAWSPDGNNVLYSTGSSYTILNLIRNTHLIFKGESQSIPYWSPNSQFLLLDGLHTLTLISLATGQQHILLSDSSGASLTEATPLPGVDTLLHPIANTIWASDSTRFLFLTRGRKLWQGQEVLSREGLYIVSITNNGQAQNKPVLVDGGNDNQAAWGYEDANTSFLFT